ncbi:hypothetical protein Bca101_029970 [Brassica carinata]
MFRVFSANLFVRKYLFQKSIYRRKFSFSSSNILNVNFVVTIFDPNKKSDHGQFAIPCTVKGIEFSHALCDTGASVSRPSRFAGGAFQGIIHFCGLFSEKLRRNCERPRGADW